MGGGDIKLYAAIGVALGPSPHCHESRPCVLCWSNCRAFPNDDRKSKRGQPIAFGPSILIGTIMAYTYGIEIWEWYISFW